MDNNTTNLLGTVHTTNLRLSVGVKGGVSVYGLGRFPVTLYKSQWVVLLANASRIREFIDANDQVLASKPSKNLPQPLVSSTKSL